MKHFIIVLLILFPLSIMAQKAGRSQNSSFGSLKIGDHVPDVLITNLNNFKSTEAKVSDFKGKLLILDFWGVYCAGCIYSMPKMDSIQQKFNDRVQIIFVTRDKKSSVDRLVQKNSFVRNLKLPYVTDDMVLSKLFEYNSVPHHVWIDENGIVKHITSENNTTLTKIADYFSGKELKLSYKKEYRDFNKHEPALFEGNGRNRKYLSSYSYMMHQIEEYGGGGGGEIERDSLSNKIVRVYKLNASLFDIYKTAYRAAFGGYNSWQLQNNRIVINVKDSTRFFAPKNTQLIDEWKRQNLYVYDIRVPVNQSENIFDFMRQDLDRYFYEFSARVEKRKTNCLVLSKISEEDLLISKSKENFQYVDNKKFLNFKRAYFSAFLGTLATVNVGKVTPLIDETNYPSLAMVDIEIKAPITNIPMLQAELLKYGLQIKEEEREIDFLVIKDN